jgi:hypothetical protein
MLAYAFAICKKAHVNLKNIAGGPKIVGRKPILH